MTNLDELKKIVCRQNIRLKEHNLVILTEGNVSQITEDRKYIVIKPSGVSYEKLQPEDMAVVDADGKIVEGNLKPSVDTPIHLEIYKKFPEIFGIAHSHSPYATIFAQAKKEILCYGTTHADNFNGSVPVTRDLADSEIETNYEKNIAMTIAEVLNMNIPAVLASGHGPFAFGSSSSQAVDNMQVLEKVAMMALLKEPAGPLNKNLLEKHYYRKHGINKYYGQN
jgi:L-ribulose-5-phosphate 4-epimerase